MGKAVLLFVMLALSSFAVLAGEEDNMYYGITVGGIEYDEKNFSDSLMAITGRLGYTYNELVDFEGRVIYTTPAEDSGAKLRTNWMVSALARFNWPMQADDGLINPHALLGVTSVETRASAGTTKDTETNTGLSYGVGIDLFANEKSGINFEWIHYMDSKARGEEFTMDYFGIGYIHKF